MATNARSRVKFYIPVIVILGGIVAAAYYQEPLSAYISMRQWDRAAPSRTVEEFLKALQAGDKTKADSLLGDKMFQTLEQDGKWVGYFLVSNAGTLDFKSDTLIGESIKVSEPEFDPIGGAAMVTAPDATGKEVPYRLQIKDGGWKITEIRGGAPRPGSGMPAPGGAKPAAPKAPTGKSSTPKAPTGGR